jgi:RHS repeat-associated protein
MNARPSAARPRPASTGFDGHGSVRFLTDSTGAITDTYDYDAFGNLLAQTGATLNNYLFAGEQFDPVLGVYFNRARYYDQRAGRFWSTDTWDGNDEDPISLHKYLYVSANPVNRVDPSGHEGLGELSVSIAIQTQLFVMAHPILTTVVTGVLLALAPDDFVNALPPNFGEELQFINAVETEARELSAIKRLLNGNWLEKFKAGSKFESWMLDRILANITKDAEQLVVKDGAAVANNARIKGSAVIDAIIRDVVTEFKTSFGAAGKYQAQQFAQYAQKTGRALEYVFLYKPSQSEINTLSNWVKEVGPEVKLAVTYILER